MIILTLLAKWTAVSLVYGLVVHGTIWLSKSQRRPANGNALGRTANAN